MSYRFIGCVVLMFVAGKLVIGSLLALLITGGAGGVYELSLALITILASGFVSLVFVFVYRVVDFDYSEYERVVVKGGGCHVLHVVIFLMVLVGLYSVIVAAEYGCFLS